jgi:hypothetical protein
VIAEHFALAIDWLKIEKKLIYSNMSILVIFVTIVAFL